MRKIKPIVDDEGRLLRGISDLGEAAVAAEAEKILASARVEPDTFHQLHQTIQRAEEVWNKPQYSPALVRVCQEYEKIFGTPRSVFYPACGIDASPLKGFPNSEVVFLDSDDSAVKVMREAGLLRQIMTK